MVVSPFANPLDELVARMHIESRIVQRCRGADHDDWDNEVYEAYFPGAVDRHGVVNVPVEEFLPWAKQFHKYVD